MTLFQSIILGIVEGVTEFLPISSTFHLIFATKFLGITESNFTKFFQVFIQAGAILPVVLLYFHEWLKDRKFLFLIGVSFIPTAVVGFGLYKIIKGVFFESNILMLSVFALVGVLFFILEAGLRKGWWKVNKTVHDVTITSAILIGLAQALAVIPGVSRAGAVIVGMMLLGYKRDEAAKYSFSLAIPTILSAAALDLVEFRQTGELLNATYWPALVVGFITAFISSFIVVRWLISYLRKNSLTSFGAYRILVVGLLLVLGFWR